MTENEISRVVVEAAIEVHRTLERYAQPRHPRLHPRALGWPGVTPPQAPADTRPHQARGPHVQVLPHEGGSLSSARRSQAPLSRPDPGARLGSPAMNTFTLCALAPSRLCVEKSCHICAEPHDYRLRFCNFGKPCQPLRSLALLVVMDGHAGGGEPFFLGPSLLPDLTFPLR